MKAFRVICVSRMSVELCGGEEQLPIGEAVQELLDCDGFTTVAKMRKLATDWSDRAKAGDVFMTRLAALVCAKSR